MNWIKEHKLISFLLLVIVLALGFLIFSISTGGEGNSASGATGTVLGKIEQPFTTIAKKVSGGVSGIFSYTELKKENEKLKSENEELQQKVTTLTLSANQLQQLKSLKGALKYKGKGNTTKLVSGDVISMDGTNWMNIFTINIGTERGVQKDDIVVNGDGLVGKVKTVGRGWAKVVSIVDENSKISFKISGNMKILGVIEGTTDGKLKGYTLDSSATVASGDKLITSGMGTYPAGITIGKIIKVEYNSNEQLQEITVKPSVDFKALQKVSVLI